MSARLQVRLQQLKQQKRCGFVPFIMAGDPSLSQTLEILIALAENGADMIELGMPFSEPMADGPVIQAAGLRALSQPFDITALLKLVAAFRQHYPEIPLILMGYGNPIFHYGVAAFMRDAKQAGIDGLILVDIPSEEKDRFLRQCPTDRPAMIQLIAPTSLPDRLPQLCAQAEGFLYYIAVKGVTGTASADVKSISAALSDIRRHCDLPIAAGFGIKTPEEAAKLSNLADLVVVGSALVDAIALHPHRAATIAADMAKAFHTALKSAA